MFKNRSVSSHQFAMVPRADIPRSSFRMEKAIKTTFDADYLVPILCEEVLPGDTFNGRVTLFARMATPIYPLMDNLHLETFFFFVPNRLVWANWKKFMGEQDAPGDSIDYSVPTIGNSTTIAVNTLQDYFGLPLGSMAAGVVNALPFRAYNLIFNEWFRDENLVSPANRTVADTGDTWGSYVLKKRGKRFDYFTSALPWTQKGAAVTLPLGTSAPVVTGSDSSMWPMTHPLVWTEEDQTASAGGHLMWDAGTGETRRSTTGATGTGNSLVPSNLIADLSTATAATINSIRLAFQVQRLLERDARGGTRYTELVRSHFGVVSPDSRLQRPEYVGGGSQPVVIHPVSATTDSSPTVLGEQGGFGTTVGRHGFGLSATEHGYIIGLVNVRADLTYQQGLRKHWSRRTRYDYYFPVFANLGEQAILNKEIYFQNAAADDNVFGYQERWAEYRYLPSEITGKLRSTAASTLDAWHLAQKFTALPTLNETFITSTTPMSRVIAVSTEPHFILDGLIQIRAARPLPMYGVPGLIDHF